MGNETSRDYDSYLVSTRTKTRGPKKMGIAAAFAAVTIAIPTAVQAYAEPETTTTTPATTTPAPAESSSPATTGIPVPTSTKVPDPQGPGCDSYRSKVPTGAGSIDSMALQTGSQAIANNPELSTFSAAISGKLNPEVNIVSVLDGGPYVVFAPTNAAFEKLDPATLETLKTDPVVLLPTLFYHMVLGYLGPNDVAGKMPTQDGRLVTVSGKGGDIKVNDNRVTCAYTARGAYIYMIDTVLTPPTPAAEASTSATTSATTTATTTPTTSSTETSGAATTTTPSTSSAPTTAATTGAATTTTTKQAA